MNYREKMREYLTEPGINGSAIGYGRWGALNPEQRKMIRRLLDEMDRADEYIKNIYLENEKLKAEVDLLNDNRHFLNNKISKAIEYIEKSINNPQPFYEYIIGDENGNVQNLDKLLKILKGE